MPRKPKSEELAKWVGELNAFTYSIQKPGTVYFNHTVLAKTEPCANGQITQLYPGARYVLISSSTRITTK
jgi:hypothetical protein